MTAQPSHGDGRRMTVAEAIDRRARMIRVFGSLHRMIAVTGHVARAQGDGSHRHDRLWTRHDCATDGDQYPVPDLEGCGDASEPGDVGLDPWGIPIAMCRRCRIRLGQER